MIQLVTSRPISAAAATDACRGQAIGGSFGHSTRGSCGSDAAEEKFRVERGRSGAAAAADAAASVAVSTRAEDTVEVGGGAATGGDGGEERGEAGSASRALIHVRSARAAAATLARRSASFDAF
jgi:hypothetical protein